VATLLRREAAQLAVLGDALRQQARSTLLTVARGSSDHAAHDRAQLLMARLGRGVALLPMSVPTLYQARLVCDGLAAFAFSQSGQSPGLVGLLTLAEDLRTRDARGVLAAPADIAGLPRVELPRSAPASSTWIRSRWCRASTPWSSQWPAPAAWTPTSRAIRKKITRTH
jgi:hypothetical protein